MVDHTRRQNKGTRAQLEREMGGKTELELYLKKAVDKVMKEKMRLQKKEAVAKKRK